jgi:hypothetical protein
VEVVIRGGLADRVVAGQLGYPGVIEEPTQDQDRLVERAPCSGVGAGTASQASSRSRVDRNSIVWSRTGSAAVYVTLIGRGNLYDLWKNHFISGVPCFSLYRSRFGLSAAVSSGDYPTSPTVTRKGSVIAGRLCRSAVEFRALLIGVASLACDRRWRSDAGWGGDRERANRHTETSDNRHTARR